MQRYKRIFGNTMKARALPQQKTEAWVSTSALNRMTSPGMSVFVKILHMQLMGALANFDLFNNASITRKIISDNFGNNALYPITDLNNLP